mgnify:CR=1 FL=1
MRKCDGFWSETERFHFFFIFEFFSLNQSILFLLLVVWSPPLVVQLFRIHIFSRKRQKKRQNRKKKMMREEDEERGGALDPLLLSEEVDSEEEDKEEKGEIDDCEA